MNKQEIKQNINNKFGVESNKNSLLKENNQEMKKIINNEFGFDINKIEILEGKKNGYSGQYDYIYFVVCGINYIIKFNYIDIRYELF